MKPITFDTYHLTYFDRLSLNFFFPFFYSIAWFRTKRHKHMGLVAWVFGAIGAHKWQNWTFGVVGLLFFCFSTFYLGRKTDRQTAPARCETGSSSFLVEVVFLLLHRSIDGSWDEWGKGGSLDEWSGWAGFGLQLAFCVLDTVSRRSNLEYQRLPTRAFSSACLHD